MFIGAMFLGLLVILYTAAHHILLHSYEDLEENRTRDYTEQALSLIAGQLDELSNGVGDWAAWDETYAFIMTGDPDYVRRNIPDATFDNLRLNLMLFVNAPGRVVFGRAFDLQSGEEMPLPRSLEPHLGGGSPLLDHFDPESSVSGLVLLPEGPLLVASRPIVTNERQGPIRGALIWGRYLDNLEIARLSEVTQLNLSASRLNDPTPPADFEAARGLLSQQTPIVARAVSADSVAGYALLEDIHGEPALILKVDRPRAIYKQGLATINFFVWFLMAGGFVIIISTMLLLKNLVLSRLERLNSGVEEIRKTGDLSVRLAIPGEDELSNLAGAINRMLAALEQSGRQLQDSEESYRGLAEKLQTAHQQLQDIIEFLPDATFVVDRDKRVIAWNLATEKMTGISKAEILGKGDYAYSLPFYGRPRPMLVDLVIGGDQGIEWQYQGFEIKGNTYYAEGFVPSVYGGQGAFVWEKASPLFDGQGNVTGAIETIRDVSERKEAEERLRYLSLHDPLTGIYNRAYFEEEMRRLKGGRFAPVGLVVCDVDGLKLVNDSLGHDAGDALLRAAAGVLQQAFRKSDVVARVGGDEFAVVLPESDKTVVQGACQRIREAVERHNLLHPELPLSLSVGYAVGDDDTDNLNNLFREADNNMYRDKLHRSQSTRSAIIQTLMKTLEARDHITEGHGERMQDLVLRMAQALGLPERTVNDLRLLAQFHDIGKVGVPDRILFKKGPLSPAERTEMQRHCEIGHRIAHSVPDLVHIADLILKHHEVWNGEGYPLGLKGEEIPLECRILAVADAYDSMTNDRPYRKAMSHREAVTELERCTGSQFDPELVRLFVEILKPLTASTS
jgi:diguanylate cyclase (GGDEF)-like protein